MSHMTSIEWCDHTFNPWRGCSKVHEGCRNCYAEVNYSVKMHGIKWGTEAQGGTRVKTSADYWKQPLKWNREAGKALEGSIAGGGDAVAAGYAPVRPRVFCGSLCDVFEDWDGRILNHKGQRLKKPFGSGACDITMDDLRRDLFALIDQTPWLDWLLVTKRPQNIRKMWRLREDRGAANFPARLDKHPDYRGNIWLLTSVSDQKSYDRQAPHLYGCRDLCPVLGFSAEPLLSHIKFWHEWDGEKVRNWWGCFDWVIAGGESGPNARPMHPEWVRSIRDECQAAGVPFFFKQWGEWLPVPLDEEHWPESHNRYTFPADGTQLERVGKKAAGRLLDGREWGEFPQVESIEIQ